MGRFQALFDVLNPIFDSIIVSAAGHLKLPLHNNASSPTLSFGDGDSGLYESSDDTIKISLAGTNRFTFSANTLYGQTAASGGIFNVGTTATQPTLTPSKDDPDTGIGSAAADQLSLIAGGVEGHRITEDAGAITHTINGNVNMGGELTLADKLVCQGNIYFTAVNLHPDIVDEASTYNNPVYVFHGDDNTGIGSGAGDSLSLIAGGVEGLRLTESGAAVSVSGAVINTTNGLSQLVAAPAVSNSAGTAGQIAYDNTYFYVCIASSTWERVELASW